jgi:hypothetical protein
MTTSRRAFLGRTIAAIGAVVFRGVPAAARRRRALLFRDRFNRRKQHGWGGPWFNQRYGRHWAIRRRTAIYKFPGAVNVHTWYRPAPVFVLDHDVADIDLRAVVSASNQSSRSGLVARASGYADYYTVHLGPGDGVRLARCGPRQERLLAKKKMNFVPRRRYHIRLQVTGGPPMVRAKVWRVGRREPGWQLQELDASRQALINQGPFGILMQNGLNRERATFHIHEVVARSPERGAVSSPSITYSLAGPPFNGGNKIKVVAKTAVPARIGFHVGSEPTLSDRKTIRPRKASHRARTEKATLNLERFPRGSTVYWRAFAVRNGKRDLGPISAPVI